MRTPFRCLVSSKVTYSKVLECPKLLFPRNTLPIFNSTTHIHLPTHVKLPRTLSITLSYSFLKPVISGTKKKLLLLELQLGEFVQLITYTSFVACNVVARLHAKNNSVLCYLKVPSSNFF